MSQRCPTSEYLGVARLNNYRWHINSRGYANVVPLSSNSSIAATSETPYTDVVYGLVYSLQQKDEDRLDVNEGVPIAYEKEMLETDFWASADPDEKVDVDAEPKRREMLVYINHNLTSDHEPKEEYIYRMNMGIRDALKVGVPHEYVDKVMRKFIPEKDDEKVRKLAEKQALEFEDER